MAAGASSNDLNADHEITVNDLNEIITEPSGGMFMLPSDPYNEVFDGIFIGEA